jgi:cellulose synthase/poly-beta-1,6-N-acetylglucosamine synthase-like glycosyltransferase
VPAYNESAYISESIRTLLSLDYPKEKLDLIIVDDGSTDDSFKIAKSFETENISLRVFTKKNGGKGAALNFGISKAKGELIATMDADSYPSSNVIKDLLPYFNDPKVMAVTPAIKIKESNSLVKELQRVEYLLILFSRKMLSFIDSVPVTPGPFSLFRKEVFDLVGNFDEHNLVEDVEMALRIQSANYKIRSSMTADVYTEPPEKIGELMKQRVRWQRGGIRNYWNYRRLINPEYGDFGMYFVPLNFASLIALFVVFGLMIYSVVSTPYYVKYIWFESFGMGIGLFTFVGAFVILSSAFMLHLAISSFGNERVRPTSFLSFLVLYWFFTLGYNIMFIYKEIRKESASW